MARKHLYGCFRFVDKDGKEHFRKPTPKQRKNILIYYLRRRSGRCMRVADIASAFHVSERTMQKLLKELEAENIIRRVPVYGESEVVCPNCHRTLKESQAESMLMTCICGHHFRIGARKRLGYMTDSGSFTELFSDIESDDPLSFPGYREKLISAKAKSGENESVITGTAEIGGFPAAVFSMDSLFMM